MYALASPLASIGLRRSVLGICVAGAALGALDRSSHSSVVAIKKRRDQERRGVPTNLATGIPRQCFWAKRYLDTVMTSFNPVTFFVNCKMELITGKEVERIQYFIQF